MVVTVHAQIKGEMLDEIRGNSTDHEKIRAKIGTRTGQDRTKHISSFLVKLNGHSDADCCKRTVTANLLHHFKANNKQDSRLVYFTLLLMMTMTNKDGITVQRNVGLLQCYIKTC
jgi:hypothetical protein